MQIIESKKAINIYRFLNKLTRIKWFKPSEVTGINFAMKENSRLGDLLFEFSEPYLRVKNNPGS